MLREARVGVQDERHGDETHKVGYPEGQEGGSLAEGHLKLHSVLQCNANYPSLAPGSSLTNPCTRNCPPPSRQEGLWRASFVQRERGFCDEVHSRLPPPGACKEGIGTI